MAKPIATVGGIALAPGVSRNGRLYTKRAIAGMVARVQDKIASGDTVPLTDRDKPIETHVVTQLTHHAAGDDSTRIVGRVTSMSLDESGRARFTADIAPTEAGKTIAALLDTSDGQPPFLRGVSGRMAWVDGARVTRHAGQAVETGDELDLMGLDYTHKPGIPDAAVDTFAWTGDGAKTETSERVLICESVEEALVAPMTEETIPDAPESAIPAAFRAVAAEPPHDLVDGICVACTQVGESAMAMAKRGSGLNGPDGPYADPGFQKDGKQRYQLDTKAHAKSAWAYVHMPKNAQQYSGAQLKRIKSRIRAALKKFGVTTAGECEGWSFDGPARITEALHECYGVDVGDPEQSGSYSVSACNGPTHISISSYRLDPAELQVILSAAVAGAIAALKELDPDMDGDIDVKGAPSADTDSDKAGETDALDAAADAGETEETGAEPAVASPDQTPAPDPAAGTRENQEGSGMTDANEAAGQSTAAPALTQADVGKAATAAAAAAVAKYKADRKAARKGAGKGKEPGKGTAEAASKGGKVTESDDDRVARMVQAKLDEQFGATESDDQRLERRVQEAFDAEVARRVQAGQIDPARKGIVRKASETTRAGAGALNSHGMPAEFPDKPLHEFSADEFDRYTGPIVVRQYLGARAEIGLDAD